MQSRRQFIQNSAILVGGAAMAQQAAAAICMKSYNCSSSLVLDAGYESLLSNQLGGKGLDLTWRTVAGPTAWASDNIQMHTRYMPSRGASPIATPESFDRLAKRGMLMNKALAPLPEAVVMNVRPFAVLVNIYKANKKGIRNLNLRGFAAKGVKPVFVINSVGFAPENSWFMPLLTSAGLFSDQFLISEDPLPTHDAAVLGSVLETTLDHFAINYAFGLPDSVNYAGLIDPSSPEIVAVYGDPISLARNLAELDRESALSDGYEIVALQDFLNIRSPSFFASQMLQVGNNSSQAGVGEVVNDVVAVVANADAFEIAAATITKDVTAIRSGWESLRSRHDFSRYANTHGIAALTDEGVLNAILLDSLGNVEIIGRATDGVYRKAAQAALNDNRGQMLLRQKAGQSCANL